MYMRKLLLSATLVALVCGIASAQNQPKKTAPIKPVKTSGIVLKNALDTFYYGLGMNIALSLQDQGVNGVNATVLNKAMNDIFKGQKTSITEQEANMSVNQKLQEFMAKKLEAEKEKGRQFMAINGKRKGVVSLSNGLQYEVLKAGDSSSIQPKFEDTIVAHYAGTLLDGRTFDNSYNRGVPLTIAASNVIPGWTAILEMMHVGDKWKVYIPSDMAYGDRGNGMIPGGATLIFEMELLKVLPAQVKTPEVTEPKIEVIQPPVEEPAKKQN